MVELYNIAKSLFCCPTLLKGMSSTFPKVRKMCFPNFRKIFSENFPNFRKIFSFFPKVRKNIFRKFGKIKFRCSHLLSIVVRFLSQSSMFLRRFSGMLSISVSSRGVPSPKFTMDSMRCIYI